MKHVSPTGHRSSMSDGARRILTFLLALAILPLGCSRQPVEPTTTVEPTTVALIESVVPVGGDTLTFNLVGGGTFTYRPAQAISDVVPVAKDLLLAGERNGAAWGMVVSHDAAGGTCYRVRAPAFAKDRRVVFENGLSLAMSSGFDAASAGPKGVWEYDQAGFCVDLKGEVISYH